MKTIAHIVNLFQPAETSDLKLAQAVTVKSMLRAMEEAGNDVSIELLSAQFGKDRCIVPNGFRATADLTRSVADLNGFSKPLALPILKDILDRLDALEGNP